MRIFLKRFIAHEVYTACTGTSSRIVPLTNLNKYLNYNTSETGVGLNVTVSNGSEKL
jgi:hypothetical protein